MHRFEKKIITICMALLMGLSMTGCANETQGQVLSAVYPETVDVEDYDTRAKIRQENQVEESFLKSLQEFSDNTKAVLLNQEEENAVYSPLSLYLALAVLANGADGQTREEMFNCMGLGTQNVDYLREQTGKLYRLLYRDDEAVTLKIANSVWAKEGYPFLTSYLDSVKQDFYADLYQVDFSQQKTKSLMEVWVKEHTGGLIEPSINPPEDMVLAIMNTIYLKAGFLDAFREENTNQDIFTKNDGTEVTCDFMNQTLENYSYLDGDGFVAASLTLSDLGKITFILPEEGISAASLVSDTEKLAAVQNTQLYERANIHLSVPKFDTNNELDLMQMLSNLGMKSVVDADTADFSNMTERQVYLSQAKQQVRVKVNEDGIEAAAFTMLMMNETAMMAPEEIKDITINLNRPFLYEVTDNNGVTLFTGILNSPVE